MMKYFELTKNVLVFKNVLKDASKTYRIIKKSQQINNNVFPEWRIWNQHGGLKCVINPNTISDQDSDAVEFIKELRNITANCFKEYKPYIDIEYLKQFDIDPYYTLPNFEENFLFTFEASATTGGWGISSFLIGDYLDIKTTSKDGLMYGYHLDRTPHWGTPPYAYSLNIYPNDNFEGGGIYFINMETAEKKISENGIEYYLIDEPICYEPEAGDAIVFPSCQFHATKETKNGQKTFIRIHLESPQPNSYIEEIKNMNENEILLKKEKAFKECLENYNHCANIYPNENLINMSIYQNTKFIVRNKAVD